MMISYPPGISRYATEYPFASTDWTKDSGKFMLEPMTAKRACLRSAAIRTSPTAKRSCSSRYSSTSKKKMENPAEKRLSER